MNDLEKTLKETEERSLEAAAKSVNEMFLDFIIACSKGINIQKNSFEKEENKLATLYDL